MATTTKARDKLASMDNMGARTTRQTAGITDLIQKVDNANAVLVEAGWELKTDGYVYQVKAQRWRDGQVKSVSRTLLKGQIMRATFDVTSSVERECHKRLIRSLRRD